MPVAAASNEVDSNCTRNMKPFYVQFEIKFTLLDR